MLKFKKGAMFGLDARIALAIFGALSVISGAALYNAIQDAKYIAIVAELREFVKAWEQYYLDTSEKISSTQSLITDPSVRGWQGPYLSSDTHSGKPVFPGLPGIAASDNKVVMETVQVSSNDVWTDSASRTCTSARSSCAYFVGASNMVTGNNIITVLDEYIDDGDGQSNGKLRWLTGFGSDWVYYYVAPARVPST
jgi:Tfp pilus assembly protein PilE